MAGSAIVNLPVIGQFKPETYVANYLAIDAMLKVDVTHNELAS